MTHTTRRALALSSTAAVLASAPAAANSQLMAAPGPWPAPVIGATNPLPARALAFNGAYATPNARLRVWLPAGATRRTAVTRPVGSQTVVRGQLRNRDNHRSISAAGIQLAAQDGQGGDWTLVGVAVTNRRGGFNVALPTTGTRRVAVLYWPTVESASPVFSRRMLLRARARVYLKATMLRGRRIVYRGRVSGAPIPPGGLLVAAQVANGPGWATVRLVRTRPSGRFVARYRFKTAGRRFRVRALAPGQPSWPLYGGHSHTQRVRSR